MGKRGPKKKQKEETPKEAVIEQTEKAQEPTGEEVVETITLPEAAEGKVLTFVEPGTPIVPESTPDVFRKEEEAEPVEVLANRSWLYHNDHEPRIFEAGPIPAGWHRNQKDLDFMWFCDPFGKWSRKEK